MRKCISRISIVGLALLLAAFAKGQQQYDVVLESSIRGSAEQPKMIFILPWRSEVPRDLQKKSTIPGHFAHMTQPVSKIDVLREFDRSQGDSKNSR